MGTIVAEMMDTGERDAHGRRRFAVGQREELLRGYRESGLSQAAFAKREGLRYSTFAHWVQRAAKDEVGVPSREGPIQFARVQLPATAGSAVSLEVKLSDGVIVRGEDVQKIAALVRALSRTKGVGPHLAPSPSELRACQSRLIRKRSLGCLIGERPDMS